MLLSQFDQKSALGESLLAAAKFTPLGCAAELSWHIQVRSFLDYIKLGDVLQPQTGIQCWDRTTTSPKELPKTRIAQMQVSQQQAFSAQWSDLTRYGFTAVVLWGLQPQRSERKDCQMCTAPVRLFWMRICVSFPPPQTNLSLKYYILQYSRKRRAWETHNSISERIMNALLRKTNKPKQS